jgi:chorismate synthase
LEEIDADTFLHSLQRRCHAAGECERERRDEEEDGSELHIQAGVRRGIGLGAAVLHLIFKYFFAVYEME